MNVSTDFLENQFNDFANFIATKDERPFISFNSSSYFDRQEKYKETIYQDARETIRNGKWKSEDIGTGRIHQTISNAIKNDVDHHRETQPNNLINNWRIKDNFVRFKPSKAFEQLLFDFYKSKGIKNEVVFDELLKYGHPYNLIAYLFFIKDNKIFLPISQQRFDNIFDLIGLPDFTTSGKASWNNYATFLHIVKQVRDFLRTKDRTTTLLDAHSFLWVLGNQMQKDSATRQSILQPLPHSITETATAEPSIKPIELLLKIAEEYEELTFPEGREIFRLHKSKERNRELIKAAKETRMKTDANLCCEVCGFSFRNTYGELGEGYIEAHHVFPISQLTEETQTRIEDLAMVCANCHRMLHRKRPWLTLDKFKELLAVNGRTAAARYPSVISA